MSHAFRAAVLPMVCAASLLTIRVQPAHAGNYPIRQVTQGTVPDYGVSTPGINDAGVVGFGSSLKDAAGLYTYSLERYTPGGSATKTPVGGIGPVTIDSAGALTIVGPGGVTVLNPDGTISGKNYPDLRDYAAPRTAGGAPALAEFNDYSIYANPDSARTRIDNPDKLIDRFLAGYGRDNSPRYTARNFATDAYGVYKGPDLQTDRVLDLSQFRDPVRFTENARGDLLFAATHNGVAGLFNGPDPVANRVTDNTTPFNATAGLLNDNGQRVLVTGVGPSVSALYAGTSLADRIIGVGDPLFGSTVFTLNVNLADQAAFNNRGEVAFAYKLNNGLSGIAVVTVPEPAGAVLLLAPCLALLRRRR